MNDAGFDVWAHTALGWSIAALVLLFVAPWAVLLPIAGMYGLAKVLGGATAPAVAS